MTLWLALLVAQPLLISRGRRALHRTLGSASYLLVPAIVVASVRLTHFRARSMPEALLATEGRFFFLPLAMIALFAASWLLAMLWRRTPACTRASCSARPWRWSTRCSGASHRSTSRRCPTRRTTRP
jgi:hypothetical protein